MSEKQAPKKIIDVDDVKKSPIDKLPKFEELKFEKSSKGHMDTSSYKDDVELLDAVLGKEHSDFLPWEDVRLPSLGLYYDGKIPSGVVEVRPMGLNVHKIVSTQRLAHSGKSIDYILKECVKLPSGFEVEDLLAGDVNFLFYYIRGITHGNKYEFILECNNNQCKASKEYEYDLNNLVGTLTTANPDLGEEPFKIVLPHLTEILGRDFWVKVRFRRQRDIKTMRNEIKSKRKAINAGNKFNKKFKSSNPEDIDEALEKNLEDLIIEVMGSTDRDKVAKTVDRLHSRDIAAISEFLNNQEPGIDTTIKIECDDCGNGMTINLPITASFFRSQE